MYNNLMMMITEDCNLRCKYCYEQNGHYQKNHMKEDVATRAIDFALEEMKKGSEKDSGNELHVTFFGGEPTLNMPVINKLFDYAVKECSANNVRPQFKLITNCTIFNDDIYDFIEKWFKTLKVVDIQVSMDGHPDIHNVNRVNQNGEGTSKLVAETLTKYLSCLESLGIPKNQLYVHGVTSKEGAKYTYESYKYIKSLGVDAIWFIPLNEDSWDDESVAIFENNTRKIADEIFEECKASNSISSYGEYTTLGPCRESKPGAPCSAGKSLCLITPNGDIYPCHRFYFADKETKFGNIYDGLDDGKDTIFKEYSMDNMFGDMPCVECTNNSCKICIAANYEAHGNMFIGYDAYCKVSRKEEELRRELMEKLQDIGLISNDKSCSGNCSCNDSSEYKVDVESLVNVIKATENHINALNESIILLDDKVNTLFGLFKELILTLKNGAEAND